MTTATKLNTVKVGKRVSVLPPHVEKVGDKLYKAKKLTNLTKDEQSLPDVKIALETITVEADDLNTAADKLTLEFRKVLVVDKPNKPAETKEEKPKAETKETAKKKPAKTKKKDVPKAETPEKETIVLDPDLTDEQLQAEIEQLRKKDEKPIASFPYFLENSAVDCFPLSPDNDKVVKQAFDYFRALNKTLQDTYKLTAEEEKILDSRDYLRATFSFINRDTIRLLIVETDEKNKHVASFLLKPLYMSPYSVQCVVEAHKKTGDYKRSKYYDLINAEDSPLTCYDAFQFNPLNENLTNSEVQETKTKLTYQFVNIKTKDRQ
jgi:hypothetical protein